MEIRYSTVRQDWQEHVGRDRHPLARTTVENGRLGLGSVIIDVLREYHMLWFELRRWPQGHSS